MPAHEKVTLVLADDHPMFRLGLKTAIETDGRYRVVAEAGDGRRTLELIEQYRPDLAVVDWNMPELTGLQVLQSVQHQGLQTRIIILTMHDDEGLFNEALEAGVHGFMLKDNAVIDILECLRVVEEGEVYLSPAVSKALVRRMQRSARLRRDQPGLKLLTPMERNVLQRVAENATTKAIAAQLGVSPHTIDTHRRNICHKLGLHGSHSLLQFAVEHKHTF